MSALKIKPPRNKNKVRGDRFSIETPDGHTYNFYKGPDGRRYCAEIMGRNFHFHDIKASSCRTYMALKGLARDLKCHWTKLQWVLQRDASNKGKRIASRFKDGDPWLFFEEGSDAVYIPAEQVAFRNAALIAAAYSHDMRAELADLLGLKSCKLCDAKVIGEIAENPRFALLRDFDFILTPLDRPIGKGRQAQNTVRHKHSNYDQMLEAAGGLLHPEVYETARRGVDVLVAANLRKAAP